MQRRPRLRHCNHLEIGEFQIQSASQTEGSANFETRRFEGKMWVYIAAHDLHIPTRIKLPIVTALIKSKDDALQQGAAQGLLCLFTKGVCLLRQAAQYLLSAVYRLTVDRCEARIGRVWQPYGQVYMDIRHIRIH